MSSEHAKEIDFSRILSPEAGRVAILMIDPHLGNFVLAVPVIAALSNYVEGGVDLVVAEQHVCLANLVISPERVIPYAQEKERRTIRQGLYFLQLAVTLFLKRYDAVITLGASVRDASITACTRAPVRVALSGARRRRVYTDIVRRKEPDAHICDWYAGILSVIGQEGRPPHIQIKPTGPACIQLEHILQGKKSQPNIPVAVIHSTAGKPYRRWPSERFAQVADGVIQHWNMDVCFIGGPDEIPLVEDTISLMGHGERAFCLVETLDLLLALFTRAALLISNESGPTHLAAAMTTIPIVTIFGPTIEANWRPIRDHGVIILKSPSCCQATNDKQCTQGLSCLTDIQVDDVLHAIQRVCPQPGQPGGLHQPAESSTTPTT